MTRQRVLLSADVSVPSTPRIPLSLSPRALVLQRYLARITRSDRQAKAHFAANLCGCTPASRSLARPQETSNVVVLGSAIVARHGSAARPGRRHIERSGATPLVQDTCTDASSVPSSCLDPADQAPPSPRQMLARAPVRRAGLLTPHGQGGVVGGGGCSGLGHMTLDTLGKATFRIRVSPPIKRFGLRRQMRRTQRAHHGVL